MPSADPESSNTPAPLRPRDPSQTTPPPAAAPPGVADLLLLARALFGQGGGEAAPGSANAPGQLVTPGQARGPLPKEQKKFYKLGNLPAPAPAPAVAPAAPAPAVPPAASSPESAAAAAADVEKADEGARPVPAEPPPAAAVEGRVVRPDRSSASPIEERTGGRRRSLNRQQRVLMIGLGVASAVGSFLVGLFLGWLARPPVPKSAPAALAAATPASSTLATRAMVPDEGMRRALATIDEAETANRAGDWTRVGVLLEQADREAGPRGVPGLLLRRAENAVRRGDLNAANALAQRSLESGEDAAKAYALRAVLAQRANRPEVALPLLEAASRADPFESRYLFFQAQSLRGRGKLKEAIARLSRALDRVEEPFQAENYRLFLRLTQVELGEGGVFADELARHLSEPDPAPDWLVTAGAQDCQTGRFQEGAELLRRAFVQAGPAYAKTRLGDVFFRPYADRPELASLFAQYLPPPPPPPLPAATPPVAARSSLSGNSGPLFPPPPASDVPALPTAGGEPKQP